jgi:hypothetical protein
MADPQIRRRPELPERAKRRDVTGAKPARLPERIVEHRRKAHEGERPKHLPERRG